MNTTTPGYTDLASPAQIQQTIAAVEARGIKVQLVDTPAQALDIIQHLIPDGAQLMTAASISLKEIGFEDLVAAKTHGWVNLKDALIKEADHEKRAALRLQSASADYFLGSVQAIAETGEMVIASNSGSQIAPYAFTSRNVILIAGTQKIVPTLEDAFQRIRNYSLPREDEHAKAIGMRGSRIGKILIFEMEPPHLQRSLNLILVNQLLGT